MLREVARWGAIGTIAGLATACLPGVAAAADGPARIVETPAVTGAPQVGSPLQASGHWRGGEPVTVTWAWLRCGGYTLDSCVEIPGANGTTYVPVDADVGSMLRVKLSVSNAKAWAWAVTPPTQTVAPAPGPVVAPPPPPSPLSLMSPRPVVRIRGWLTPRGVRVTALTVRAPGGARITVRCRGARCPRARWAHTASLVHLIPFQRRLRAGTRLIVTVTRPGFVGKWTKLVIRRGKAPARVDRCLYPDAPKVRACPSS